MNFSLILSTKLFRAIRLRVFNMVFSLFLVSVVVMPGCLLTTNCAVRPATPEERTKALDELRKAVAKENNLPADSTLAYFEKRFPDSEAASLARFRRGYDRYADKDYSGAANLLDEKAGGNLEGYALYFKGRALFEGGQADAAQAVLVRLAETHPEFPYRREALLLAGRAAAARRDLSGIERTLKTLIDAGDGTALSILATAQEETGQSTAAAQTYRRIWFEAPHSPEKALAETKLPELGIELTAPEMMDPSLRRIRAGKLFENKQYVSGAEAFAQLETLDAEAVRNDTVRFQYGVCLFFAQKYAPAAALLGQVVKKELAADALYYRAEAERKGAIPTFLSTGERFLSAYPKDPRAGDVLAGMAQTQEKRGNGDAYYARLIRLYPEHKAADDYSFKRAWAQHKAGNAEAASNLLLAHVADFPRSDYKGMCAFWAARDEEKLGRKDRALAIYEAVVRRYRLGYYGQLSLERVRQLKAFDPGLKADAASPKTLLGRATNNIQPAEPLPETAGREAESPLRRASDLRVIGLMDLATVELEAARLTAPTSRRINLEIARVYRDKGETLNAVRALQRAHPDYLSYQGNEMTKEEWQIFFPMVEWETIQREARANGLDPYVVAGLIRQESVFNPKARSRANAYGLMQLLPSTGRLVAKKNGVGALTAEQLYNPKLNIQLGTIYLSDMIKKFGRNEYAFAAYNGGPGRVATWLRTLPTDDIAEWVEAIPISETRLYVQGVTRNTAHYRRLYGDERTGSGQPAGQP